MPAPTAPAKRGAKLAPVPKPKSPAPSAAGLGLPELTVNGVKIPPASCLITRARNLELLGWEAEETKGAFGDDYTLIDQKGRHVRLKHNAGNREYKEPTALARMQDFLNSKWRLNGETAIFSGTGQCLSYQHRGVGYEFAWQRWEGWADGTLDEAVRAHWQAALPAGPVFPTLQVHGVAETEDVTRTIDSVRERTNADVFYTSDVFADLKPKDRSAASRACEWAVKLLWSRVGQDDDAFTSIRTNSEVLDFVRRHPRLVEAITHVTQENAGKEARVEDYVGLGTAAGLLYLMGAAGADRAAYLAAVPHSEAAVTWKYWKRAKEFWTALAEGAKELEAVRKARRPVEGEPADPKAAGERRPSYSALVFGPGARPAEKVGVLVKAWNEFAEGNRVTPGCVKLEYANFVWAADGTLMDGFNLVERPSCGGIDQPQDAEEPEDPPETAGEEQEVEGAKATERAAKDRRAAARPAAGGPDPQLLAFLEGERAKAPGALLLFKGSTTYRAQEEDAARLAGLLGLKPRKNPNALTVVEFDHGRLEEHLAKMHAAGLVVAVSEPTDYDDHGVARSSTVTVIKKRLVPARRPEAPPVAPAPPVASGTANGTAVPPAPGPRLKKRPVPLRGGIGN